MNAIVTKFYADLPKGTQGKVIKSWTDPNGYQWHRLFLGKNRSGKRLVKSVPENCLSLCAPFETTHKLDFLAAEHPVLGQLYKIGTCEGQYGVNKRGYYILTIINNEPGNGHLTDVFEWFENSAKRDNKNLQVLEIMNRRFYNHLMNKKGFGPIDEYNVIKLLSS